MFKDRCTLVLFKFAMDFIYVNYSPSNIIFTFNKNKMKPSLLTGDLQATKIFEKRK